uniref:DUF7575 domain-containing protein n=1 Tax=Balaenoptera musculus TaxID=9771 RepID=A0A8C0I0V3_BALMU
LVSFTHVISCPDCGKGVEATFKFCPYCGKPLPTEEHEGSQTFVKPSMSSSQALQQISSALPLKHLLCSVCLIFVILVCK